MDEDEYKDFDSDNTSDPDGFDDEEMSDDESFFARPGEQQQQGASSISSQVRFPFSSRPSSSILCPSEGSRTDIVLDDLLLGRQQDPRLKHLSFPNSLPYLVESLAEMDDRLDLILTRLTEAILLKDWEVGFWKWHREFSRWLAMKVRLPSSSESVPELMLLGCPHRSTLQYPLKREMRVNLVKLYFELAGASSLLLERLVELLAHAALLCSPQFRPAWKLAWSKPSAQPS